MKRVRLDVYDVEDKGKRTLDSKRLRLFSAALSRHRQHVSASQIVCDVRETVEVNVVTICSTVGWEANRVKELKMGFRLLASLDKIECPSTIWRNVNIENQFINQRLISVQTMQDSVVKRFAETFGREPEYLVRCPGRVNLMGEHIDYNGYPTLPIAIQEAIYAAVLVDTEIAELVVHNVDTQFEPFRVSMDDFEISAVEPTWQDYYLCGVRGALELIAKCGSMPVVTVGFHSMVGGSVPIAAGLSSSSALVCAAALSTVYAILGDKWSETITMQMLAEECARAERYVGTQGGGMDQAICLLAEKFTGMLVEFDPLRLNRVSIPQSVAFVVCNSMVKSEKGSSKSLYNFRVAECRLAAKVMAKLLDIPWRKVTTLRDLHEVLRKELREMPLLVGQYLHENPYSLSEILLILECQESDLTPLLLDAVRPYQLHNRALHVYEESLRVHEFRRICDEAVKRHSMATNEICNVRLGELLKKSHASCSQLYECSCKELDDLQRSLISQFKGAVYGARLTGAGWGGCLVANIDSDGAAATVERIRISLLKDWAKSGATEPDLFLCRPSAGASVKVLKAN
uniref:Galactokinase n=1 Tax=Trichuris muris TaxID=70415 RepID=A0A5S6QJX1_TRIMR